MRGNKDEKHNNKTRGNRDKKVKDTFKRNKVQRIKAMKVQGAKKKKLFQ